MKTESSQLRLFLPLQGDNMRCGSCKCKGEEESYLIKGGKWRGYSTRKKKRFPERPSLTLGSGRSRTVIWGRSQRPPPPLQGGKGGVNSLSQGKMGRSGLNKDRTDIKNSLGLISIRRGRKSLGGVQRKKAPVGKYRGKNVSLPRGGTVHKNGKKGRESPEIRR